MSEAAAWRTRVLLLGGPHDGQETEITGRLPESIRMPVPQVPGLLSPGQDPFAEPPVAVYRNTGSIRDDGTRVYEYARQR